MIRHRPQKARSRPLKGKDRKMKFGVIKTMLTVEGTVKKFGALHIACNNADIGGPLAVTGEYPVDGWDKVIAINLSGGF